MSDKVEGKDEAASGSAQTGSDKKSAASAASGPTSGSPSKPAEKPDQTAASASSGASKPAKAPGRGGGGKLLVALVFLALIFAACYYSRDTLSEARSAIETARQTLDNNQQQIAELAGAIGQLQRNQQNLQQTLTDVIQDQQGQMARFEARLDENQGYSNERWQVAEARYLVRLADQRVRIAGDVATAIALLEQANGMLRDTGQARYTDTRAVLIEDISQLRAAGEVDTQGLYLQISAVARRLADQPLQNAPGFAFGEQPKKPAEEMAQQGFWGRSLAWLKASLAEVLLVRRADETSQWMLDNASESAIRAQVGLLSTQALSALLSGNQNLYQQSLASVAQLVQQHYEATSGRQLLLDELDNLAAVSLNRTSLDLDDSLQAMEDALALAEQAGD